MAADEARHDVAQAQVSDADYLLGMFEEGWVPPVTTQAHGNAIPDYYQEDEVVHSVR